MRYHMHVKKNDTVKVISGKEKGKTGKITRVFLKDQRVIVEKLNMVKKHTKPSKANPQGGIISKEMPMHCSNVKRIEKAKKVKTAKKEKKK